MAQVGCRAGRAHGVQRGGEAEVLSAAHAGTELGGAAVERDEGRDRQQGIRQHARDGKVNPQDDQEERDISRQAERLFSMLTTAPDFSDTAVLAMSRRQAAMP